MKIFKLRRILFLLSAVVLLCASCDDKDNNSVEVTSVTITPSTLSLKVDDKDTLTVTVEPQNADNKAVAWSSNDTAVVEVSNSSIGEITAKTVGTANITVTSTNGKTAKCVVTVTENEPVGEILDLGDGSIEYEIKNNLTLSYPNTYILKGFVYVPNGVTLTIEPGVVVRGDKESKGTLIVERGGKINAAGTAERPIVFTSNQASGQRHSGDWGGLILLGKAPNNAGEQTIEGGVRSKHGGTDPHDNSGTLKYLRVEFAGIEYSTDNEINGITLGSVGDGTVIEYVQVSYSGDDSFEWFGGTVNAKHLIAYHGWDDDFDTDNGFSGKIQFVLGVRNSEIGDKSASNGFESDNNSGGSAIEPYTSAVFANVSLFGPVSNPANYSDRAGVHGSTSDARFQAGLHLRRNTQLSIFNSAIAAFPIGVIIENDKGSTTQQWATDGKLNVANTVFAGHVRNFQDRQYWTSNTVLDPSPATNITETYVTRENGGNQTLASLAELKLSGNYFPASDSPLATGANWSNTKVASGFDKVSYCGAFAPSENADSNWTKEWANFDPQNTAY
ncbi:MAG: Ig-like domain-containing protein [Prevotellaceae bacterium]|jgi:hypothetical protein|nr:Ig-like domain-containing protein [Prevotellaceae bacterium]